MIDGQTVINIPNRHPRVFDNLNLFAGSGFAPSAVGTITNFTITSEECFLKKDVFESSTTIWDSPAGYIFEDSAPAQVYYKLFDQRTTISNANATCESDRGQTKFPIFLPGPINDDENNQLRQIMEGNNLKNTWLGIQRSTENITNWIYHRNLQIKHEYFNWGLWEEGPSMGTQKEPDNFGGGENYVMVGIPDSTTNSGGTELFWYDVPFDMELPFICLSIVRGQYSSDFSPRLSEF